MGVESQVRLIIRYCHQFLRLIPLTQDKQSRGDTSSGKSARPIHVSVHPLLTRGVSSYVYEYVSMDEGFTVNVVLSDLLRWVRRMHEIIFEQIATLMKPVSCCRDSSWNVCISVNAAIDCPCFKLI